MKGLFLSRNRFATFERGTVVQALTLLKTIITDFVADPARDTNLLQGNSEALTLFRLSGQFA
jgi:hypothetical protein